MVDTVAFQTRARTIDHLGREQIADCPTAISELWKNSYDAYARSVALHLYNDDIAIAALVDDGHGMSREDFIEKWLVVGTESKATGESSSEQDRNGLPVRQRQGQKGIGRLSSAALGPLLLLVSKRKTSEFVAALIDWRLFENPFLYLHDIEIPVVSFQEKENLSLLLPGMFDELMGNIWGAGKDPARDSRIATAWAKFDEINEKENRPKVRESIENVIINTVFADHHLAQWPVWAGKKDSGTALIVADISFDLEVQLSGRVEAADEQTAQQAKDKLFQTLSNFTDPYLDIIDIVEDGALPFEYSVTAWDGELSRTVISRDKQFGYSNLESLEHVLDGYVDSSGIFTGRVRAFGKWLDGEITVLPKAAVPTRIDTKVGPFHLRLGTFEQVSLSSTHPPEIHSKLLQQAEMYAGFMVYRNDLRVMPYGREDNDFFEIEKRRGLNAGREFWSYRRLFGRVALSREQNPNLKDKAGREGIIDNKAAKVFRDIVENILMTTARRYFGSASPIRKEVLPGVKADRQKELAEEAQRKIKTRKRREFRQNLKKYLAPMGEIQGALEELADQARNNALPEDEQGLMALKNRVGELKITRAEMMLGAPPENLGASADDYQRYKACSSRAHELIVQLDESLTSALRKAKPQSQRDLAYSELTRNATFLQNRVRKWSVEVKRILSSELNRIGQLVDEKNKNYHATMLPLLDDLENSRVSFDQVMRQLEQEKERQDKENTELFESYISTLRNLEESVDLDALVGVALSESAEVREQINRLNSLAQLGITVEIIGHEIEGFETTITRGLREMPDIVKEYEQYSAIKTAHEGLSDRLRFLSPLKLSGERLVSWITGQDIYDYVVRFLEKSIAANNVRVDATESFLRFSVYEQSARIYPVFINLINNAVYWVGQKMDGDRRVLLDVSDDKVWVSDTGPGVEASDVVELFSLFFTRKVRGGRGVGLYLCRANLAAGGHAISYVIEGSQKKLDGANFMIEFKGATYE